MADNDPSGSGAFVPLDFDPPSAEELTSILEGYEVLAFLAKGSLGTVYKARQPHLDRLVALKILPARAESGARFIERFQREAQTMAKLRHDHIMTIHDFGETTDGKYIFIAMEWVEGTTLERAILQENFSQRHILAIVTQVCDALQYAHEHGVIHRDIKPANIMLDVSGQVKVADFGLAQIIGPDTHDNKLTHSTASIGMPDFVAPEQLEPGQPIDHRADVYSIGVILYKMLTGYIPRGTFLPPSRKVPGLDPRLDAIVATAMAADPADRYPQISRMWQDVAEVHTNPITAPQTTAPQAVTDAPGAGPATPKLITGRVPEKPAAPPPPEGPPAPEPAATPDTVVAATVISIVGSVALILAVVAIGWIMTRDDTAKTENRSKPQTETAATVDSNKPRAVPQPAPESPPERRTVSIRRETQDPTPPPTAPEKAPPAPNNAIATAATPAPPEPAAATTAAATPGNESAPAPADTTPDPPGDVTPMPTPAPEPPDPAPEKSPTVTGATDRIAAVLAPFQERYAQSIGNAHRAELASLNEKYLAALARSETVATKAGNLDAVVALRNEAKAVGASTGSATLPDLPPGAPQALQNLRDTYTGQIEKLEAARDADAMPLLAAYDKALENLQADLTRALEIDAAVEVKAARDELRDASPFTPGARGLDAPPVASNTTDQSRPGQQLHEIPEDALRVTPDGADGTLTLEAALAQAEPRQTIALAANSIYEDPVIVKTKDLTIIGNRSTINRMIIREDDVTLRGIEFGNLEIGQQTTEKHFTPDGIRIEHCRFQSLQCLHHSGFEAVNCIGMVSVSYNCAVSLDHCTLIPRGSDRFFGHGFWNGTAAELSNCVIVGSPFILQTEWGPGKCRVTKSIVFGENDFLRAKVAPEPPDKEYKFQPFDRRAAEQTFRFNFSGCIFEDPQFIDPVDGDFRLAESSPGKGKSSRRGRDLGANLGSDGWPNPGD